MLATPLFRLLGRLPLSWLHRLGGWAGRLTWWLSPTYRRRLRANLTAAVGAPAPALLDAAIAEAGRQALELPWLWQRPLEEVMGKVVRVEGWPLVEAARAAGRPVLYLTPHLGCFEITAQYCATVGPITVLYRPPRKAELHPIVESGRARGQVKLAPTDMSGVRRLVKALRDGESVGMLPDQVPGQEEGGVWAPFFGRPAWTMTLAARLAEVRGVEVIMVWAERLPRGRGYVIRYSAPQGAIEGSPEARCAAINREIERLIVACPAQYLWGYHRYKRPSGVPKPEASGEAAC